MSKEIIEAAKQTAVPPSSTSFPPSAPSAKSAPSAVHTPTFIEEQEALGEQWLGTIKQAGLRRMLADSDLPEVVKKRLARNAYNTPDEVLAAIAEAHEELQVLDKSHTVELSQRPYLYVSDPIDDIPSHVEWFFGVEGAKTPPPNFRKLDQLYVAMTGNNEFYDIFQPDRVVLAAADTGTLAGMAVDDMNKVIMNQFSRLRFWRWYENITYVIPNDGSVQGMKLITFGGVGPTLAQDSTALFHADHNNIQTTALGTDNTAWRAARKECFGHTEVNSSKPLAVFPKFLLVPDDLYHQALVNLGYGEGMPTTYVPEAQDRGIEDPRPVPLVVPDWTDAADWAYIVDPMIYPVIQISYAQAPGGGSHPAPELYSVTDPRRVFCSPMTCCRSRCATGSR